MEDKAWKKILKPYLKALRKAKIPFKVNRRNVRNWVLERAVNVKKLISEKLKDRLFHIKVDATTKNRRSFLGINAQYLNENNEIEVLTLATEEMFESHTAENIKKIIVNVLKSYDLYSNQIYAFVSDNGANMLKTAKLFNENQSVSHRGQSASGLQDTDSSDEDQSNDDDDSVAVDDLQNADDDEWEDFSIEENVVDERAYDREKLLADVLQNGTLVDKLNSVWKPTDDVICRYFFYD